MVEREHNEVARELVRTEVECNFAPRLVDSLWITQRVCGDHLILTSIRPHVSDFSTMDPASSFLITKMKAELRERGGSGFHALQRKFRIMDDDGSKTLSMAEFKKAMKEMNFEISDKELGNLYRSFGK